MIKEIKDTFTDDKNIREVTFKYDIKKDSELLVRVKQFISDNQPTCFNCENYYEDPCLGGYMACSCKIHGCIEVLGHPHYDTDGSKCREYKRKR